MMHWATFATMHHRRHHYEDPSVCYGHRAGSALPFPLPTGPVWPSARMKAQRFAFLHTTSFRWVIASASVFAGAFAMVFGFIYWQTAGQMRVQFDGLLQSNAEAFVG